MEQSVRVLFELETQRETHTIDFKGWGYSERRRERDGGRESDSERKRREKNKEQGEREDEREGGRENEKGRFPKQVCVCFCVIIKVS